MSQASTPPLSVVVLAAGEGKRMHSDLPKVLQPLAGRPLLAHVLGTARGLGAAEIHVVFGHGGECVRERFPDADLKWALQARQLGTGHAVAQALPAIAAEHRVLVLCGDVPLVTTETLRRLLAGAEDGGGGLAFLSAVVEQPRGYGRVVRDAAGQVTRVVEEKDASPAERQINEINVGLMTANSGDLRHWIERLENSNAQGEYYLTDVVESAVDEGRAVRAIVAERAEEALGINDRVQLAAAERIYQQRAARALLVAGATLADPQRIDVRGELEVGRDVFIDVGVVFEGKVTLGDRVAVGPYAVIADSRLGDDCLVHPYSVLRGVAAGPQCEIGPFSRLRPGSELASSVKVGNFVEVKNSRVAKGSKMNHLSYVGDTDVGTGVNIGAGTITCNYDGAAKHRTVIGDRAFIGSGVMLVAPVVVGNEATIGAGSTITSDAPPGTLTLTRARQQTVEGWRRPKKRAASTGKSNARKGSREPASE
jgi:bifunctional UDP-N-acetylglucosamine pyrophosphorylase / glucosamine-1-phosphate N-acetyltransferase